MSEVWVGVDVSKGRLDVAIRPGDEAWSVENSKDNHQSDRLKMLIEKNPEWNRKAELLNSVPGVGVLISSMIAELPELGTMNRKQPWSE